MFLGKWVVTIVDRKMGEDEMYDELDWDSEGIEADRFFDSEEDMRQAVAEITKSPFKAVSISEWNESLSSYVEVEAQTRDWHKDIYIVFEEDERKEQRVLH